MKRILQGLLRGIYPSHPERQRVHLTLVLA